MLGGLGLCEEQQKTLTGLNHKRNRSRHPIFKKPYYSTLETTLLGGSGDSVTRAMNQKTKVTITHIARAGTSRLHTLHDCTTCQLKLLSLLASIVGFMGIVMQIMMPI